MVVVSYQSKGGQVSDQVTPFRGVLPGLSIAHWKAPVLSHRTSSRGGSMKQLRNAKYNIIVKNGTLYCFKLGSCDSLDTNV